jgi:hypothetical protein
MKDRINTEGIDVVYCPTEDMLADFFTKPLQGSLFVKFRDVIMGLAHISTLRHPSLAPVKERVGTQDIQDMDEPDLTKVKAVMTGANGQAADALTAAEGKPTYAGVLKRSEHTRSGVGALESKNEFTN